MKLFDSIAIDFFLSLQNSTLHDSSNLDKIEDKTKS